MQTSWKTSPNKYICQVSLVIGKLLGQSLWYLDEAGVIPGLTERRKEDEQKED